MADLPDSPTGPIVPLPPTERQSVTLAWGVIGVACALYLISLCVNLAGPSIGARLASDGEITSVAADGPAAGRLQRGDRIEWIGGMRIAPRTPPLHDVAAGRAVTIALIRAGKPMTYTITPETRAVALARSLGDGVSSRIQGIGEILRIFDNAFVMLLAIFVMSTRPRVRAARLAAMVFACWSGGNSLLTMPGYGALLSFLPDPLLILLACVDLLLVALFFAMEVHFALIFPRPLPFVLRRKWPFRLAYAAIIPMAGSAIISALRFYIPRIRDTPPALPNDLIFVISGPVLLLLMLVLLFAHFPSTTDTTDRRRLTLVIAASVPGIATWIVALVVAQQDVSDLTRAIAYALVWIADGAGFGLFAYALVRYRIFGFSFLIRKSIRYAFARGTLIGALALPAIALLAFLYAKRGQTLQSLVTRDFAFLVTMLLVIGLLVRRRETFLDAIDRRFFREQYDARRALLRLGSMIRRGTDIAVIGRIAIAEIEQALHPRHVSLWTLGAGEGRFEQLVPAAEGDAGQPLPREAALVRLLGAQEPVDVDADPAFARGLPPNEAAWLRTAEASLLVPLMIEHDPIGFLLLGSRLAEEPYGAEDRELLKAIAAQLAVTEDHARLESLARRDPLTNALNRHAFYSLLQQRSSGEASVSGSVVIADVNEMKEVNDTWGHSAGDTVIRVVASAIRGVIRAQDLVFRWGGDEFLIIVFGLSSQETARRFASVKEIAFTWNNESFPVTVSVGVAPFDAIDGISAAIEAADRSMYLSKAEEKGGRMRSRPGA